MTPQWTVLLIGGASGTGKSTLAARLSRSTRVPWIHADDFRMAIERAVKPPLVSPREPLMSFFHDDRNWLRHTPAELTRAHRRISAITCKGLAIVVSHHLAMDEPLIIEGDDILPSFAARMSEGGGGRVRAVTLVEHDDAQVRRNMLSRDRGITRRPAAMREQMIALALADGRRIERDARRHGVAVLPARPFGTLPRRVLEAARR